MDVPVARKKNGDDPEFLAAVFCSLLGDGEKREQYNLQIYFGMPSKIHKALTGCEAKAIF
jgi:hypothetical protein